jgi:hypothetical protein
MNRPLLTLAVLSALAVPAAADEHLVTPQAAQAQLLARESARARDLAAVDAFVASADGQRALGTLGVQARTVRAALPALSDAELAELAGRTAALQTDPVAGALSREVIWIGAIALAAIILIILIA